MPSRGPATEPPRSSREGHTVAFPSRPGRARKKDLAGSPETTCAEVRASADAKLEDVRRRIEDLQQIERGLADLAKSCRGVGPVQSCPILAALDDGSANESYR